MRAKDLADGAGIPGEHDRCGAVLCISNRADPVGKRLDEVQASGVGCPDS
jgi:hypothetical protein